MMIHMLRFNRFGELPFSTFPTPLYCLPKFGDFPCAVRTYLPRFPFSFLFFPIQRHNRSFFSSQVHDASDKSNTTASGQSRPPHPAPFPLLSEEATRLHFGHLKHQRVTPQREFVEFRFLFLSGPLFLSIRRPLRNVRYR